MGEPTDEDVRRCAKALLLAVGDVGANSANQILKATEHSGDCTKQPWTCNVCYADEHRKMARTVISEMRAIEREKTTQAGNGCPAASYSAVTGYTEWS